MHVDTETIFCPWCCIMLPLSRSKYADRLRSPKHVCVYVNDHVRFDVSVDWFAGSVPRTFRFCDATASVLRCSNTNVQCDCGRKRLRSMTRDACAEERCPSTKCDSHSRIFFPVRAGTNPQHVDTSRLLRKSGLACVDSLAAASRLCHVLRHTSSIQIWTGSELGLCSLFRWRRVFRWPTSFAGIRGVSPRQT